MKKVVVTFTFDVDITATDDDIDQLVYAAGAQFSDPADEEGERAAFDTAGLTSTWETVDRDPADARTCRHCGRTIFHDASGWVDPEATGDDSVWHEGCEAHEAFPPDHEPMP